MNLKQLEITNLETGYGKRQVIFDISLYVDQGEIVSVIGPNGSGKSTILKAIYGLLPAWKGIINFNNESINKNQIHQNINSGLVYSPQGNRVFDELTVFENMEIGGFSLKKNELNKRIDIVLEILPQLKNRLKQNAGTLSGGEQQMLALARILMPYPKMLLLDEPSLGLAPNLISDIFEKLKQINKDLKVAILIVEQKVNTVLSFSDRVYSIKLGKIAFDGKSSSLINNTKKLQELFL